MDTKNQCSVCQIALDSNYCPSCGQEVKGKPITLKSAITDFISNVFSLERSVFALMFALLYKPYWIVSNYWNGNRKYYPSPGKVFFYSLAVAALHISFVDEELILGATLAIEGFKAHIFFWMILLPLIVLSSFLVYIKRERTLVKSISSLLYLAASFFTIITVVMDLVNYLSPDTIQLEAFLVFLIMVFIWNSLVFDHAKKAWQKALNSFLQLLIFLSFIAILVLMIYLISPDSVH